jgi:phospholipase C
MGHLNLVSGQTHGATPASVSGKVVNGSVIANIDPTLDDCSSGTTITMSGKNIGDLLNAKSVTWGWFYGDWTPANTSGGKANALANTTVTMHRSSTTPPRPIPITCLRLP